jgi:hypothetical protein
LWNSESLLTDTDGRRYEEPRLRRGILNFVGGISKFLLGTLDENDTQNTLNDTLADILHNDKLVRKGLSDIQTYLNTLPLETARKRDIFRPRL